MNRKDLAAKINKLHNLLMGKDVFYLKERRLNYDYAFDLCEFLVRHSFFLDDKILEFFSSDLDRLILLYE